MPVKLNTILVVGGAGYIGSHMVKALAQACHNVIVLDDLSRGHRDLVADARLVVGSAGDARLLDTIFTDERVDAVMHFAARSLVGESVANPIAYYRSNVAWTVELLDAMVRHGVLNFIFSSSAAVYGEPHETPIRETHPCRPTNPYGATKLAVEGLLAECARAYGIRYASLRYFNAAGADQSGKIGERHQPETHLIPLILEVAAGRRDAIAIFGTDYATADGTCVRDYVHVSDLAQAHLLALEALLAGTQSQTIYNLGSSRGYSVRQVIEVARNVTGHAIATREAPRRSGDPAVLVAASEKIKRELGWRPNFEDLETIIETAWTWHRHDTKGPTV
jgi:UDP-glucose 4-epimerase